MKLLHTELLNPEPEISVKGAVALALEEIAQRRGELPPPGREVKVCNLGPNAASIATWLNEQGWRASLTEDFKKGANKDVRYRLWEPSSFLAQLAAVLPPGRALEPGCGCGRNSVYLASLGWEVVAFDRLDEAIEQANDLQERYWPEGQIEWRVAKASEWKEGGFDLIASVFFYNSEFIQRANQLLNKGGNLIIETLSQRNEEIFGKPKGAPSLADIGLDLKGFGPAHTMDKVLADGRHTACVFAARAEIKSSA